MYNPKKFNFREVLESQTDHSHPLWPCRGAVRADLHSPMDHLKETGEICGRKLHFGLSGNTPLAGSESLNSTQDFFFFLISF